MRVEIGEVSAQVHHVAGTDSLGLKVPAMGPILMRVAAVRIAPEAFRCKIN